ncbi:lysozyme inhibitor LprI family protein [Erwinia oleae]|uniref:lysozyme inhibitor LprI family protein n=1 Tax=Erwinia oleae TaxID=796334 RepID=UPI001F249132|nr:lysozyme inhibitor LprI family protein [Erwinia oleae]
MKIINIFIIGLSLMSVSVRADDDCSKSTNDPELFSCVKKNRAITEKELNYEYAEARKRIEKVFSSEPEIKKQYQKIFLESQRGWLTYRENQCKIYAHVADKSSNPYILFTNDCANKINKARIDELRKIPYDG